VKYGASIRLLDEDTGKEIAYKIVSEYKANV
jgi:transcription elongation GreA/GreB family factor